MNTWKEKLKAMDPCPKAYKWAVKHKTLREAWRMCERSDWMWWLIDEIDRDESDEMNKILGEVMDWGDMDSHWREELLVEAYIILYFMPDPPRLPEIT